MSGALVAVNPMRGENRLVPKDQRANAGFLAHLIATATGLPQTRARRRAEPEVALSAYRTLGQWPTESGRVLSRSL